MQVQVTVGKRLGMCGGEPSVIGPGVSGGRRQIRLDNQGRNQRTGTPRPQSDALWLANRGESLLRDDGERAGSGRQPLVQVVPDLHDDLVFAGRHVG